MKSLIRHTFFSLAAAAVMAAAAFAQTPTPKPTPDDDVIRVESRLVVVPVSVTDPAGQPVAGLTAESFRVKEEGKPQTIERVSPADKVPLEIALLFDISATTSPMFKFQQETAAKFLKEVMKPEDRAAVFTIGETPGMVRGRDTSENAAAAVLSIRPTKQYTAFYDSVGAASDYLQANAPDGSRRVVVVISDGEDTNSTRIARAIQDGYKRAGKKIDTLDSKALYALTVQNRNTASMQERVRILKQLQNADTVFYSINPAGSSYLLNKMSVFGQENMAKFADDTGGTAFLPKFLPIDTKDEFSNASNMRKNGEVLDRIFRQLANELRSQYLIQYYSEAEFSAGRYVKLDVALANPGTSRIRARQGYYVK